MYDLILVVYPIEEHRDDMLEHSVFVDLLAVHRMQVEDDVEMDNHFFQLISISFDQDNHRDDKLFDRWMY